MNAPDVDADDVPSCFDERLMVTCRLGCDDLVEGVVRLGHGELHRRCVDELDEPAPRRSPFVQLTGGVEEPRAPSGGGGHPGATPHRKPQLGDCFPQAVVGRKVGMHTEVVAGVEAADEVAERRDRIGAGERAHRAEVEITRHRLPCEVFRSFHVRLVERVNAHHRSSDGGEGLGAQHLVAERRPGGQLESDHRETCFGQTFQIGSPLTLELVGQEHTVGAVLPHVTHRFVGDRNDPGSVLAEALCHQLFHPRREGGETGGSEDGQFVPPCLGRLSEPDPDSDDRVPVGIRTRLVGEPLRGVEQARDIDSHECRRHEAEVGEGGKPPTDVGVGLENGMEAPFPAEPTELRVGVGDGDETPAVTPGLRPEVSEEGQRLECRPRLGRDHEAGAIRIDPRSHRLDRPGMGGVQDDQLGECLGGSEHG